jgi:integrase
MKILSGLIDTDGKTNGRYGHRDATMILLAYRHGLRASELCDLQWHQVELNTGRLHVRRSKGARRRFAALTGPGTDRPGSYF